MRMNSTMKSQALPIQTPAQRKLLKLLKLLALAFVFLMLNLPLQAVSLHPSVKEKLRQEGKLADYQRVIAEAKANGLNAPVKDPIRTPAMINMLNGQKPNTLFRSSTANVDTVKVLVILADFSDNPYNAEVAPYVSRVSATPTDFQNLLFSTDGSNPTGSMAEYYIENSYGTFLVQGVVTQWYRMPKTYDSYVGTEQGLQSYAPNAQDLAMDAVNMARPDHDFSQFDSYGPNGVADGKIDGLFIVHAGTGFEDSNNGGIDDIHSHKWQLRFPLNIDGVNVSAYSMEPEESYLNGDISPIGVFVHEYGHFLGLPDLYDFDESGSSNSEGLGRWSVMASGNWLGSSKTPSHYDAWSKVFLGFVNPTTITENLRDVAFPQVEDSPTIYRINGLNMPSGEYFLVENRQKVGFDVNLPGSGLLIYHIDEAANPRNVSKWGNWNVNRYLVALEQADGRNDLAYSSSNLGDAGDPFTSTSPEFTDLTTANSKTNTGDTLVSGQTTQVAVWNISASGPNMTANLDKTYSRPNLELLASVLGDNGDGDGVIESNEQFDLTYAVRNLWANGANTYVEVRSTSSDLTFTTDSISIGQLNGFGATSTNVGSLFSFTVAPNLSPRLDTIFFEFHSDNELNVTTLPFEVEVGAAEIMIVNAGEAGENMSYYTGDMRSRRTPYRTHVSIDDGPVTSAQLISFKNVIWFFGDNSTTAPTSAQKQAIREYLDNGGNLLLSGQNLVEQLGATDPTFLATYLHATDFGSYYSARQAGVASSPIADGITETRVFGNGGASNWGISAARAMTPTSDASPALVGFGAPSNAYHALTFDGSYKLAFFSFPFEALEQSEAAASRRTQRRVILNRVFEFFNNIQTDVADDDTDLFLPESFALEQNYPNPFNPNTTISYTIKSGDRPSSGLKTELVIYNVLGQQVRNLVDRQESPGEYSIQWNGSSDSGEKVASGVYFYRLKRGDQTQTRKMVLLK